MGCTDSGSEVRLSVSNAPHLWKDKFPLEFDDEVYFMPYRQESWTDAELGRTEAHKEMHVTCSMETQQQ
eukprot:3433747-Amphidinium_carterae.1